MPHIVIDSLLADDRHLAPDVRTKLKILRSIDRSLKTISVQEICEKCGLSRATFYYHFKSKNEIPLWYSKLIQVYTLAEIGRTLTWEEGLLKHYELLFKERDFYFSTLDMTGQEFSKSNMRAYRKDCIVETLTQHRRIPLDEELDFCIEAFLDVEIERAQRWFGTKMSIAPDVYARYLRDCVPKPLYDALSLGPQRP
ncbi:TetR/AcrR family transcriptional regulator [Arabiibacter massiliensis]|uniref:TetR/AcrR family transcriptional regulator n=1 Tax=Arabiibacter massiliensis TaxID=1870985 RepID=UPI00155AC598|nr:helix-turn-helix domain-containing protein [Arabiibacter massiliensis]